MATQPMETEQKKDHWVAVRISSELFSRVDRLAGPRGRGRIMRRGIELALAELEHTSAS